MDEFELSGLFLSHDDEAIHNLLNAMKGIERAEQAATLELAYALLNHSDPGPALGQLAKIARFKVWTTKDPGALGVLERAVLKSAGLRK